MFNVPASFRTHASHILEIVSLFLERVAAVLLAILMLRLHIKMAKTDSLSFMQAWLQTEKYWTYGTVFMFVSAFLISLVNELLLWRLDAQEANAANAVQKTSSI